MGKSTFILAKDLFDDEDLEIYSDEEMGQILKAIFRFVNHGEKPEFQDKGLYYIFKRFVSFNDENEQKYQNKVDGINKARESNSKVQKSISENRKEISDNRKNSSDIRKENSDFSSDTDTVTDTDIKEKTSTYVDAKEKGSHTHSFGEYHHVKLSDSDIDKLNKEYGQTMTDDAIQYLDEYIEMKGYKAKNHYLCIRKWVIDALKERQQGKNTSRGAPKQQGKWSSNISDIAERNNDYARILANIPDPLAGI